MTKTEVIDFREFRKKFNVPKQRKTPISTKEFKRVMGMGSNATWEAFIACVNPLTVQITIPGSPIPSQNVSDREHWSCKTERREEFEENLLALRAVKQLPTFERAQVLLVFYTRDSRRRDTANYVGGAKQLLDALVRTGFLPDDNHQVMRLLPPQFDVDRENPRTVVFVSEWREVSP